MFSSSIAGPPTSWHYVESYRAGWRKDSFEGARTYFPGWRYAGAERSPPLAVSQIVLLWDRNLADQATGRYR